MAHAEKAFEAYAETGKAMFDYWISFFPTAPMFGVEWRFGEFVETGPFAAYKDMTAVDTASDVDASAPETTSAEVTPALEASSEAVEEAAMAEPAPVQEAEEVAAPPIVEDEATEASVPPMLYSAPPAEIDDLKAIKGVGPGLESQLHYLGIYKFEQLADFDSAQMEWLDENLKTVKGRCIRDDWAGQAKSLLG